MNAEPDCLSRQPAKVVVSDVVCPVCGCACDDLRLTLAGEQLVEVERACDLAQPWFERVTSQRPPAARIDGRAGPLDAALEAAADILRTSRAPLIYGLSRSSTPGQRAAVELAEALGGIIDTTASVCHGPSIMAIQSAGESTSSLGEIRQRADLVLFWGADPAVTHPRHGERYSLDPVSEFLPRGRQDRHVVVIDIKPTRTSELADEFLQVKPGHDFEVIWQLRRLIRGEAAEPCRDLGGIEVDRLRQLADRMRHCRYGVVFFGLGLAQARLGHLMVDGLLRLVADLNACTRFTARRLRIPGDVTGADSVLCWQTGFPFGVDFSRGYPRYNPGEFTANDLLERREVDSCLIVGSESLDHCSSSAREFLRSLKTICLDYPGFAPPLVPQVHFTTAVYGLDAPGTIYRMDEVPLPLRSHRPSPFPTDEAILTALRERL